MSRNDVYMVTDAGDLKPRGLLHALSEIEQFSVAERTSSPIPEEALTTINLLSFFNVGVKTAMVSVLVTALLSPFMFAVQAGIIPVFGSYFLSTFDRVFVVLLSVSFSLGASLLIFALLRKVYCGNVTKKAIHSLVGGFAAGSLFASFFVLVAFHILRYRLFTPENLVSVAEKLSRFVQVDYRYVYLAFRFCDQLVPSAYFQFAVSLLSVMIVVCAIVVGRLKTRRLDRQREVWQ